MRAAWLLAIACVILVLGAGRADAAFVVPRIQGHLTDTAGVLSPEQRANIEQRLAGYMDSAGIEIAVFVVDSLQGDTIEDVAYQTFNTWRIGREKLDNGVLLVIARKERRLRIETGKGVGGQLTDLQASDIIDHRVAPRLREGNYYQGIVDGADAIAAALGASGAPVRSPTAPPAGAPLPLLVLGVIAALVLLRIFGWRMFAAPFFWAGGRGGRWGGGRSGGGGGGGYSGGGGRSGGGGASGSW